MPTAEDTIREFAEREYQWGFSTELESDAAPPGLSEEVLNLTKKFQVLTIWTLSPIIARAQSNQAAGRALVKGSSSAWILSGQAAEEVSLPAWSLSFMAAACPLPVLLPFSQGGV